MKMLFNPTLQQIDFASTLFYTLSCTVCCLAQLLQVTVRYFSYDMTTSLVMDIPQLVEIPGLSVCWRYADIIDLSGIENQTAIPKKVELLDEITDFVEAVQSEVTIQQIFELTPPPDSVLKLCRIRYPGFFKLLTYNETECRDRFHVVPYYVQENICYRLDVKHNGSYHYSGTASSLADPGTAYEVGFDKEQFKHAETLIPIVHKKSVYPTQSRFFAPQLRRYYNSSTIFLHNKFHLSNSFITNTRLPAPYPSNCLDYNEWDLPNQEECFTRCIIGFTKIAFDKFPFSEIIWSTGTFAVDKKHINNRDLEDQEFNKKLMVFEQFCRNQCKFPNCKEMYSITRLISVSTFEEAILFKVDLSRDPSFFVTYQPMLGWNEFMIYTMSVIGAWTGLSMLTLNPLKLIIWGIAIKRGEKSFVKESMSGSKGFSLPRYAKRSARQSGRRIRYDYWRMFYDLKDIRKELAQLKQELGLSRGQNTNQRRKNLGNSIELLWPQLGDELFAPNAQKTESLQRKQNLINGHL